MLLGFGLRAPRCDGNGAAAPSDLVDPSRTAAMRYSAFISYNHKDRRWAAWLHRELERYRLPQALVGRHSPLGPLERRLPPVFPRSRGTCSIDQSRGLVREALDEAASLIVICSRNGAASRWVNEEVRAVRGSWRANRIQCLLVPEAGDARMSSILQWDSSLPPCWIWGANRSRRMRGRRRREAECLPEACRRCYRRSVRRAPAARACSATEAAPDACGGGERRLHSHDWACRLRAGLARTGRARTRHARQKTVTAQRTTDFVKGLFEVADPQEAKGRADHRRWRRWIAARGNCKASLKRTQREGRTREHAERGLHGARLLPPSRRPYPRFACPAGEERETRARQLAALGASRALQGDYAQREGFSARF